jgi:hypothetical protein
MPGSLTTPGRPSTCVGALDHVAFRHHNGVSAQDIPIAAQWLAYAIPYRRFTDGPSTTIAPEAPPCTVGSAIPWTCVWYQ